MIISILLVTIVVLVGKTVNCATMSFITGQTFRESILIGVGLARLVTLRIGCLVGDAIEWRH